MPGALRLYLHYVRISIRSQLQYRAAFVISLCTDGCRSRSPYARQFKYLLELAREYTAVFCRNDLC